jgi:hypothetical protein
MAENKNDEGVIERNGVLATMAWIGPAKMFVLKRGAAYRFGIFALTPDRLAFATDDAVLLDEARANVAPKWPSFLAGSGFWIKTPSASHAIHFRRPFPDAPVNSTVIKAVGALDDISNLSLQVALGLSGADLVNHLVVATLADNKWKGARATTARVRAALEE